jgi:hypothetical protein
MNPATVIPVTYKAISSVTIMPRIETARLFGDPAVGTKSPIDIFFLNTNNINKLYLNYPTQKPGKLPPELGAVVVLGYMSAVESYVRSIVTEVIRVDKKARDAVAQKQVSFAAAFHLPSTMLPEALLENISLADASELQKAISTMIGLKSLPKDVTTSMETFSKICHLRHCCVHRFGRLGTKNAIGLGLDEHSELLERPFSPTVADIADIADALQITVKTINNFLFWAILERTFESGNPSTIWQMNYTKDRELFQRYYKPFALKSAKPSSPSPKEIYLSFMRDNRPRLKRILTEASIRNAP